MIGRRSVLGGLLASVAAAAHGQVYRVGRAPGMVAGLRVFGAGVAFPPADLFAFTDTPTSGAAFIRDRPGWMMDTTSFAFQVAQTVASSNFVVADGSNGGSRGISGQDIGRTDGGQLFGTLAGSTAYDLAFNRCDENNYLYLDVTAAKNRVRIFKVLAGASTTVADSLSSLTVASGDIIGVKYAWSGSTCTITF